MADFFDDQNKMDEDDDIIVLYNEERDCDEEFYHLATLDVDDKWFVVLKPVEELPDIADDEVLIYEIVEGEEGDVFKAIEDVRRVHERGRRTGRKRRGRRGEVSPRGGLSRGRKFFRLRKRNCNIFLAKSLVI